MTIRRFAVAALLMAASVPFLAQAPSSAGRAPAAAKAWSAPRTADGKPDLQGVWSFATITPMERPAEFAGKEFLTEQEASAFEKRTRETNNMDRRDGTAAADAARAYNDFWWDRGTSVVVTRRSSLVIDPPDGRIPAITADAQRRNAERQAARRATGRGPSDGPEDRPLAERCIMVGSGGAPFNSGAYNNNVQITQTRDHLVLVTEMIHDTRIVDLTGRPHLPQSVRQWLGDSIGRWEGDTLVVETTNFTDRVSFRGSSENMRLVERFTRTADDTLMYQYTVNDPATFTKPWTVEIPMWKSNEMVYEYACHEGNTGMAGVLAGARAEEKEAAAKGGK